MQKSSISAICRLHESLRLGFVQYSYCFCYPLRF